MTPHLSCFSCRGYPINPEPFKCMWGNKWLFPRGGTACVAFEYDPGSDERVKREAENEGNDR